MTSSSENISALKDYEIIRNKGIQRSRLYFEVILKGEPKNYMLQAKHDLLLIHTIWLIMQELKKKKNLKIFKIIFKYVIYFMMEMNSKYYSLKHPLFVITKNQTYTNEIKT